MTLWGISKEWNNFTNDYFEKYGYTSTTTLFENFLKIPKTAPLQSLLITVTILKNWW